MLLHNTVLEINAKSDRKTYSSILVDLRWKLYWTMNDCHRNVHIISNNINEIITHILHMANLFLARSQQSQFIYNCNSWKVRTMSKQHIQTECTETVKLLLRPVHFQGKTVSMFDTLHTLDFSGTEVTWDRLKLHSCEVYSGLTNCQIVFGNQWNAQRRIRHPECHQH